MCSVQRHPPFTGQTDNHVQAMKHRPAKHPHDSLGLARGPLIAAILTISQVALVIALVFLLMAIAMFEAFAPRTVARGARMFAASPKIRVPPTG
jgi:hypothetical protein